MARENNTFKKSVLFKPSAVRRLKEGSTRINDITIAGNPLKDQSESRNYGTGSFRYDPPGMPIKSTQQLNVDWGMWENHTFFNSAQIKVQTAFDKIINEYPFDGTEPEYIDYIDALSGFNKHVLNLFPKNIFTCHENLNERLIVICCIMD